jgi:hypothetical protein
MLGFGLLGAAIAAYIRTDSTVDADATGGQELGRVIVRGLSAAVVLFLAVKGGLAVLAVGEQDPNAYVLFFLCMVGAVYSEDVWRWARERFLRRINDDASGSDSSRRVGHKSSIDAGPGGVQKTGVAKAPGQPEKPAGASTGSPQGLGAASRVAPVPNEPPVD